jgi:hypothetical protein
VTSLRRTFWIFCLALAPSLAHAQEAPEEIDPGVDPVPPAAEEPAPDEALPEETAPEETSEEAPAEDASEDANEETDTAPEESAEPAAEVRAPGQPPSIPRRAVPDYDGRADPGPTTEEALLWIPRVIFFPIHVVFEYVLRQPIGWFLTTAEREQWNVLLIDFFTWNERTAGLVPTGFFDFGFQPSAGLFFWWNNFGAQGNDFRAQIGFGGVDWLRATVSDRVRTSQETELAFTVDAWRRPDYVFHGFGWEASVDDRSRYFRSYVDGDIDFRLRPWRQSEIAFSTGVTWNDFAGNGYTVGNNDPSLDEAVAQGRYEMPPGFDGYTAYRQRLDVAIDSREPRPLPGHGVRVEGFVEQGFDVENALDRRWLRYGGTVGGFVDLSDNRVLALWGLARFADPLGNAPVPFIEQVTLGGDPLLMGGYLRGELIGRSAVVATLEYRYPIWVFLDGSLHFSVGNVFDEHLRDFEFERLRMSFGLGLRSVGDRDQSFNLMVAFGSEPFVNGGTIDSVRLVIGSQQGF